MDIKEVDLQIMVRHPLSPSSLQPAKEILIHQQPSASPNLSRQTMTVIALKPRHHSTQKEEEVVAVATMVVATQRRFRKGIAGFSIGVKT